MRFSIRWLMAATAYVALAIAAMATGNDLLADFVWAVSLLAICFAFVVACIARQQKRAVALGFVMLAVANLIGLYLIPYHLPVRRVFSAAGYYVDGTGRVYERDTTGLRPRSAIQKLASTYRAANAISTLAAGLIGCFIGQLAYRYGSSHDDEPDPARDE